MHLNAPAETVWDAIHDPAVFTQVSRPLLVMQSLEQAGFPQRWAPNGSHRISIRVLNLMPLGEQTIDILEDERADGTRVMTDAGKPLSGALAVIRQWRHRMAVTPRADGSTLYRDRLDVSAGLLTPILWLSLWAFWQWRAFRLRAYFRSPR